MKYTYEYFYYGKYYTAEFTEEEKEAFEKKYGVVCIRI